MGVASSSLFWCKFAHFRVDIDEGGINIKLLRTYKPIPDFMTTSQNVIYFFFFFFFLNVCAKSPSCIHLFIYISNDCISQLTRKVLVILALISARKKKQLVGWVEQLS